MEAVIHRERLAELERLLRDIVDNPTVLTDDDFDETLSIIINKVDSLWNDAKNAATSGGMNYLLVTLTCPPLTHSPNVN